MTAFEWSAFWNGFVAGFIFLMIFSFLLVGLKDD